MLVAHNINRALVLCTPSWTAAEDGFSIKWGAAIGLFKLAYGNLYSEMHSIGAFWSSQPTDKVRWTLFRVPRLTDGDLHPVKEAFKGDGKDGMKLSRQSMAAWVLKEMTSDRWIEKAPMLSGKG